MKTGFRMNRLALLLCLVLLFTSVFALSSFADKAKEEKLTLVETREVDAPKLSYHTIRYYGGFVTRWFGSFTEYVYDQPLVDGAEDSNVILRAESPSPMYEASLILGCLLAYLLGSFNFAAFISKRKFKDDVRNHGSGNAGMTNMLRTYGKKAALFTLLGDVGKAVIAVFIGLLLVGDQGGYFAGLLCIFGHAFPIFYRFKGGKGVACTAAVVLVLEPVVFLFLFIVFAGVFLLTKYVSLASIMAMLFYPVILSRFYSVGHADMLGADSALPLHVSLTAILIAVFVIFLHRANIKRLYNRQENKTVLFKKKKKQEIEEKI